MTPGLLRGRATHRALPPNMPTFKTFEIIPKHSIKFCIIRNHSQKFLKIPHKIWNLPLLSPPFGLVWKWGTNKMRWFTLTSPFSANPTSSLLTSCFFQPSASWVSSFAFFVIGFQPSNYCLQLKNAQWVSLSMSAPILREELSWI